MLSNLTYRRASCCKVLVVGQIGAVRSGHLHHETNSVLRAWSARKETFAHFVGDDTRVLEAGRHVRVRGTGIGVAVLQFAGRHRMIGGSGRRLGRDPVEVPGLTDASWAAPGAHLYRLRDGVLGGVRLALRSAAPVALRRGRWIPGARIVLQS